MLERGSFALASLPRAAPERQAHDWSVTPGTCNAYKHGIDRTCRQCPRLLARGSAPVAGLGALVAECALATPRATARHADAARPLLLQARALIWRAGPINKGSDVAMARPAVVFAMLKLWRCTGEAFWLDRPLARCTLWADTSALLLSAVTRWNG